MQRLAAALLVLMLSPFSAYADDQCTDQPECWPEGSAMHTGLLTRQKEHAVEKRLAAEHEKLFLLVASASSGGIKADERLLSALKSQQNAWLKYRSEECELVGSLTGAGGSWSSTYAAKCDVNHAEQRLRRVRSAISCIEKIQTEKRLFEQNRCLQQLAPLTNK